MNIPNRFYSSFRFRRGGSRAMVTVGLFSTVLATSPCPAVPIIYEPFEDNNGSLSGNIPGTGLSGTWAGSASVVSATPLTYGDLATPIGNEVNANNQNGYVSVGSTLSDAGLLDDGDTLWFSLLVRAGGDIATNGDLGFVLGTDQINSGNNIPISNSGQALGFRMKNNQLRAAYWSPGILQSSGASAPNNTLFLVAGKFTWGATSDMVEIYKVETDLSLTLSSTYITAANVDQSLFDTISFGTKSATPNHRFDEIRFGATSADVLPAVPEPGSVALLIVAMISLGPFRRRSSACGCR